MTATLVTTLTGRDRAILRAVATGSAELVAGTVPDLLLDGRFCCDQPAAHRLAYAGLIAPAVAGRPGQRVAATVTPAGRAQLIATNDPFGPGMPPRRDESPRP